MSEEGDDGDDGDDEPGSASTSGGSTTSGGDGPPGTSTYGSESGDDEPGTSTGSDDDPGGSESEGGDTDPGGSGAPCDPLLQDCPELEGCYPDGDAFTCAVPNAAGGQVGDACVEHVDCDLGLFCIDDVCVASCEVGAPDPCVDPADVCAPWYAEGTAPPGLEHVGTCAAP